MAETKPTPEPWSRGRFLNLRQYENMSDEWKQDRQREEEKLIFAHFHESDEGRSRVLIATLGDFDTDTNADLIISAPTLQSRIDRLEAEKAELLEILKRLDAWANHVATTDVTVGIIIKDARAVLAKEPESGEKEKNNKEV